MKALLAVALMVTFACRASTFYVTTTGNDSTGDGSVGSPWLTLDKALSVVTSGNEIEIAAGDYPSNAETYRHGPIVIRGAGATNASIRRLMLSHSNYTVLGLHVLSNYVGLNGLSASYNVIASNLFTNGEQGVYCLRDSGDATGTNGTSFNRIVSNTFSNMTGDGSVVVLGVSNLISSNLFANLNGWDAIRLWGLGTVVSDNTFRDNVSGEEAGHGNHADIFQTFTSASGVIARNIVIERNRMSNNSCTLGMIQSDTNTTTHSNWIFRNNTLFGCRLQCEIFMPGFQAYNNTIVSNTSSLGFRFAVESPSAPANDGKVFGNAFVRCVSAYSFHSGVTGEESDYNFLSATNDAALTVPDEGVHSINGAVSADTLFVDIDNGDLRPVAGSVLVGAGTDLSAVFTDDCSGSTRIAPWDIGAYEYTGTRATVGTVNVGTLNIAP